MNYKNYLAQRKIKIQTLAERNANGLPTLPLKRITLNHIIYYPTPYNLHYGWSFGSLAGIFLSFQIITGFFLAMHYVPNIDCAFNSVDILMREVNYGWTIRFMHANGASLLFLMLYLHIGKALYFRSYTPGYTRALLFYGGVVIFLLMMGTAFIGYVLPWGQMSLWGATVITNLLSAIPFVGEQISYWIWGGFAVGNPTLNRFYSFHYMLPFIVVAFILLHLTTLHVRGSTNPLGTKSTIDHIDFFPYYYIKDAIGLFSLILLYCLLVYFFPNLLGHSDNFIKANSLVTPTHIVPEWYFLPFYAILRACPNKLGGVVAMLSSILILFILPTIDKFPVKTPILRRSFRILFGLFATTVIILGILGGCPAEGYYVILSQIFSIIYFSYFILLMMLNYGAKNHFAKTSGFNKKDIAKAKNFCKNDLTSAIIGFVICDILTQCGILVSEIDEKFGVSEKIVFYVVKYTIFTLWFGNLVYLYFILNMFTLRSNLFITKKAIYRS